MANLVINAVDAGYGAAVLPVVVTLTDGFGTQIVGSYSGAGIVSPLTTQTNISGTVTVSLTPNALIDPANTYYTVRVGERPFLISKGADSETIPEALEHAPLTLPSGTNLDDLADVDAPSPTDGQVLTWDTDHWEAATPSGTSGASEAFAVAMGVAL